MNVGAAALMLKDSLFNFVSGLGTSKDPRQWATYQYQALDRMQLEAMYRSDWLARRIVELPADDATREWRQWAADRPKLEKIDALERKLEIQKKVRQALIKSRLYGGAALVLGVDQGDPQDELDLDKVGKDDLKFVVVFHRYELAAGPRIYNVDSPYYTRPQYYTVATPLFGFYGESGEAYPNAPKGNAPSPYTTPPSTILTDPNMQTVPQSGMVMLHPSRVIEFAGNELPDWRLAPMGGGWGDSVLQTVEDSLKDFAMIMGGLASMINDMKLDVVKIPELSRKLSTADMTAKTLQRFGLANMAKSTINTLLLDKDEDWTRIQTSFGSTPELIRVAMQVACAAGGVPESRMMGNAPAKGLDAKGSSGGEVDIRNYYDDIASQQKSRYKPALQPLDVCIQRSALGTFDPGVDYVWNPLYQPDPAQAAQVALVKAQATQVYVNSGLINEDALREATISQLTEDKIYPGLEDALDEFGSEPEQPPAPPPQMLPTPPPGMVNKGHFEANPFAMLRAQQAAKQGQPIRVPPHPSNRPPIPAPGQQPTRDEEVADAGPDDEPRDEAGRWTAGGAKMSEEFERHKEESRRRREALQTLKSFDLARRKRSRSSGNENDPKYAQDVHAELAFFAGKDRDLSMGAANYIHAIDQHFGTPKFDAVFERHTKPFAERGYPSKGTPAWNEAVAEVRRRWREQKQVEDFNPHHDPHSGEFTTGMGAAGGPATGPSHVLAAAAKASSDFIHSPAVKRGIGAALAGIALRATAAVAHESTLKLLHQGVEYGLDTAVGAVGAHLLTHAGVIAAGGAAAGIAPFGIAVIAGIATKAVAERAGITEENARKALATAGHYLIDHFHELTAAMHRERSEGYRETSPAIDAEPDNPDDPLVLRALKLLVPYWDGEVDTGTSV